MYTGYAFVCVCLNTPLWGNQCGKQDRHISSSLIHDFSANEGEMYLQFWNMQCTWCIHIMNHRVCFYVSLSTSCPGSSSHKCHIHKDVLHTCILSAVSNVNHSHNTEFGWPGMPPEEKKEHINTRWIISTDTDKLQIFNKNSHLSNSLILHRNG